MTICYKCNTNYHFSFSSMVSRPLGRFFTTPCWRPHCCGKQLLDKLPFTFKNNGVYICASNNSWKIGLYTIFNWRVPKCFTELYPSRPLTPKMHYLVHIHIPMWTKCTLHFQLIEFFPSNCMHIDVAHLLDIGACDMKPTTKSSTNTRKFYQCTKNSINQTSEIHVLQDDMQYKFLTRGTLILAFNYTFNYVYLFTYSDQ